MTFRYRLAIACEKPGVFRFPEASRSFQLRDHSVELVARNADTLEAASKVHFDGHEFGDEQQAREAGERLRTRLRVLDAVLGLGLNVPADDSVSGASGQSVKQEALDQHGIVLVDSVFGLAVHPNDGRHVEHVFSAEMTVRKADATYLLEGMRSLWEIDLTLDERAQDALAILGAAGREPTDRARFLTTYLALESLIPRRERSPEARSIMDGFKLSIQKSDLPEQEKASLLGAVGALNHEGFPAALRRFLARIQNAPRVHERPLAEFLETCIATRNAIAHRSPLAQTQSLNELTKGLREVTLSLIWTLNRIPSFSVDVPPDTISFAPGAIQIRVL
jgi:hypothetical protein